MSPASLNVHNAQIKTATVEIRTLTVSGKQVTLAVFRQLRKEMLLEDDGTLNGEPWGTVNYHPDKCDGIRPHLHVVWQRGSELLRSNVGVGLGVGRFWSEAGDEFVNASYCANGHRLPDWAMPVGVSSASRDITFTVDEMPCAANPIAMCDAKTFAGFAHLNRGTPSPCAAGTDLAPFRARLVAEVAKEKARRDRYLRTVEELKALPQLFIAV